MVSQLQIEMRRQKVKEMLVKGIPIVRIAQDLGLHRHTIQNDIKTIKEEFKGKMHVDTFWDFFAEMEMKRAILERYYWDIYGKAVNCGTKSTALRDIWRLNKDWMNLLGKLGIIEKFISSYNPIEEQRNQVDVQKLIENIRKRKEAEMKEEKAREEELTRLRMENAKLKKERDQSQMQETVMG